MLCRLHDGKAFASSISRFSAIRNAPPIDIPEEILKVIFDIRGRLDARGLTDLYFRSDIDHIYHSNIDINIFHEHMRCFDAIDSFNSPYRISSKAKDRYSNVLPLSKYAMEVQSGYINASIIVPPFPILSQYYIASQAPIPSSIYDFWSMIWDEKCPAIVMVTKVTEVRGDCYISKSSQYWPSELNASLTFKSFTITNRSIIQHNSDLIHCKLEITKDGEVHYIDHLQYTGWPDHGVPQDMVSFYDFLHYFRKLRANYSEYVLPVIHCSAGIGRTGTLISLDMIFDFIENLKRHVETDKSFYECTQPTFQQTLSDSDYLEFGGDIDMLGETLPVSSASKSSCLRQTLLNHVTPFTVFLIILTLRSCRPGMVQTTQQYIFIHSFLNYCISQKKII